MRGCGSVCLFAKALALVFFWRQHHWVTSAFSIGHQRTSVLSSTVQSSQLAALTGEEINRRLQDSLAKLRKKDRNSRSLSPEELTIVFEDDHIIVIDKPSGVLSVPSCRGVPSLAETVHKYVNPSVSLQQMVVHRLGMDTSGLIVMGKHIDAIRNLNTMFRSRRVTRQYTALVCGHVPNRESSLSMPLMRDYENPPYMRVSTNKHQAALVDLDPEVVGKKILQAPKTALTHYVVEQRETIDNDPNLPVTRLLLTSISGRTHQLNVHLAALGFPIVQDKVYGPGGLAAPFGGLEAPQHEVDRSTIDAIFAATADRTMCAHASLIRLKHPISGGEIEFTSKPSF